MIPIDILAESRCDMLSSTIFSINYWTLDVTYESWYEINS